MFTGSKFIKIFEGLTARCYASSKSGTSRMLGLSMKWTGSEGPSSTLSMLLSFIYESSVGDSSFKMIYSP